MILLMDGVIYEEWTPPDEATLAQMVKEHHGEIFGKDAIYFDIKQKVSGSLVAAIPDGYAITFDPDQWWVVEVELSKHDVYGHIQPQMGKFLASVGQPHTKTDLQNRLWQEINADERIKLDLQRKKGPEIFKFLSDLLAQTPKLAIIIDRIIPPLDDLAKALPIAPTIVEFRTFRRQGAEAVHIHQFEPLVGRKTGKAGPEERLDTIVVPAREDGFRETFLGEGRWYAIRIDDRKVSGIKYIAAYRVAPVSAITHWAPVRSIEPWPEEPGKFVVNFAEKAKEIKPIRSTSGGKRLWVQGPVYTSFDKLLKAKNLDEIFA